MPGTFGSTNFTTRVVPFEAVDLLRESVEDGAREGIRVRFGDATRRATLEAAGAARARAVVVAIADPSSSRRVGFPASVIQGQGAELFRYLDMKTHFYGALDSGIINLFDLVYYVSLIALGLFTGTAAVEMRRWK